VICSAIKIRPFISQTPIGQRHAALTGPRRLNPILNQSHAYYMSADRPEGEIRIGDTAEVKLTTPITNITFTVEVRANRYRPDGSIWFDFISVTPDQQKLIAQWDEEQDRIKLIGNINSGGAFLKMQGEFDVGAIISVDLIAPVSNETMAIPCNVRHIRSDGIGVQFHQLNPNQKKFVKKIIDERRSIFDD